MSQMKGSSALYKLNSEGQVQRLAKELQRQYKLTYAAALTKARTQLGCSPIDVGITYTPTLLSVLFAASLTLNGATASSYAWDFGDGNTSTAAGPTNVYAGAGTYTVTLTVTDADGMTASRRIQLTVAAA